MATPKRRRPSVCLILEPGMPEQLKAAAEEDCTSVSAIARRAILDYLKRRAQPTPRLAS